MESSQVINLTPSDINEEFKISQFPDFFECPICFCLKENLVQCSSCSAVACNDCMKEFSMKREKCKINLQIYECMLCGKAIKFNDLDPILKQVMLRLTFKCPGPCG